TKGTSQILRQVVLPWCRNRILTTADESHVSIGATDQHQGRKERENDVFIHGHPFSVEIKFRWPDWATTVPTLRQLAVALPITVADGYFQQSSSCMPTRLFTAALTARWRRRSARLRRPS